ncbi:MAG: GntR family transcriptional regulator [Planctomycetota bacterium]
MPPTAIRHDQIVRELRREIVSGRFAPGDRLPTRERLEARFNASSATIQRAFDTLARQGFIVAAGRRGTFVADRPPHRHRFAVVFGATPQEPGWNQFHVAVHQQAMAMDGQEDRNVGIYLGVQPGTEELDRLYADMEADRLAGIFFHTPPFALAEHPVVQRPDVPRVSFLSQPREGLIALQFADEEWIRMAVDRLADGGARRVAAFLPGGAPPAWEAWLRDAAAGRGLAIRPGWVQKPCICPRDLPNTRAIAELLMQTPPDERPDGLVVMNDNFVEHVSGGVVASGVRVPDACRIVAHCNIPNPPPSALPVEWLGFDVRDALDAAFAAMLRVREGETPPAAIRQKPVFANEAAPAAPEPSFADAAPSLQE